ncbi:cytochrome c [Sphingomonas vulcanisoli]|uniref:Cytochrome c n=1 Tax=Sphingomonas vulcanisoli TaxID=1658060 RepID=A0ABX0TUX7_9SPHN|nr:cytochrome c family protein [Sphingomonas vulcanisoli]NIJ08504.1 cytochrome c [Sphingomonas vulcanisoli]
MEVGRSAMTAERMETMPFIKPAIVLAMSALAVPFALEAQTVPSAPNPVRGKQLFLQCQACHTIAPGAPNAVGPNLSGVVGAKAASRPGYAYSPALSASGLNWNATSLDAFIKRPSQAVPGTKMTFGGIADAKARGDIIAYLATLKGRN